MRSAERMTDSATPAKMPRSPIFATPRTATPRTATPRTPPRTPPPERRCPARQQSRSVRSQTVIPGSPTDSFTGGSLLFPVGPPFRCLATFRSAPDLPHARQPPPGSQCVHRHRHRRHDDRRDSRAEIPAPRSTARAEGYSWRSPTCRHQAERDCPQGGASASANLAYVQVTSPGPTNG